MNVSLREGNPVRTRVGHDFGPSKLASQMPANEKPEKLFRILTGAFYNAQKVS